MNNQYWLPAIAAAHDALSSARGRAESDPARPLFHFRPEANWMNDPNGTIYHNGYYHLFYQLNPYDDVWGNLHWGHARSTDLVNWEHLPIALWPSHDLGEAHCFSGCAAVNGLGQPVIVYTSVGAGDNDSRPDNEQWMAIGSSDWKNWRKLTTNPVLSLHSHGGPPFEGTWRDPYIFTKDVDGELKTFLVLAGNSGTRACVALYEARHISLCEWDYRSILYETTTDVAALCECPNFLQVDGKWILLTSPYRPVEYIVGDFCSESYSFRGHTQGVLDTGANECTTACYYATNTASAPDGRVILFGWIRGFPQGQGWNGCLALPRELTIGEDNSPRQKPARELERLRLQTVNLLSSGLHNKESTLDVSSNLLEIEIHVVFGDGAEHEEVLLQIGESDVVISAKRNSVSVNGQVVRLPHPSSEMDIHLFLDRSVLEVFIGGGQATVTQVISLVPPDSPLTIKVIEGQPRITRASLWYISPIW